MLQEMIQLKICSKCNELKSTSLFAKNSKYSDGHHCWCRPCHNLYRSTWGKKNKERVRLNKTLSYFRFLNLSKIDYLALLEKQNNSCAICNKTAEQEGKNLAIDHCHNTNRVRGLLCSNCNTMIGLSKDSSDVLIKAASYIKENA